MFWKNENKRKINKFLSSKSKGFTFNDIDDFQQSFFLSLNKTKHYVSRKNA